MDLKAAENIVRGDPSKKPLELPTRRKENVDAGEYQYTQGQRKRYNPQENKTQKKKKIEVEL